MVKRKRYSVDWVLLTAVLVLAVFGIAMVYSASSYQANVLYGDKFYYLKKQIIGVAIGLVAMALFTFVPLNRLKKFDWLFLVASIIGLGLVFIPALGKTSYGASRWINLGPITIQPSEIAKFGFIFFSASRLSQLKTNPKTFRSMLPTLLSGGIICLLIILEPNMSITMCVGLSMLVMLFIGGCSIKHFIMLLIPVALMVPLLIVVEPYRMQRLTAFLDPWSSPLEEGFQLIQSYYALGSGGLFGVGFGNSRQKNLFLPFAESDFIFSIIGEEFGFCACVLVVLLYILVVFRGFSIAKRAKTRFECYLATGITALIAIQTFLNIAVVTGTIPPTGLPLPFISAGSTSLVMFIGAIGVLLNVYRNNRA